MEKSTKENLNAAVLEEFLKSGNCGYCVYDPKSKLFDFPFLSKKLLGIGEAEKNINIDFFKSLIFNKEDRDFFEKGMNKLLSDHQGFLLDFRTLIQTGSNKHSKVFMLKFSVYKDEFYLGTFFDITNQRKIEKEILRLQDRTDKEENFRSVFLKNLSHEIRTPMNAILGFSEMLGMKDLNPNQIDEYSSIIRLKGRYLLTLLDDVIELAKFESDEVQFNKTEFDLSKVLHELFLEYDTRRIERGKENLQLKLNIPSEFKDSVIYTDPGRLQQILGNLLSNALKFTEKGIVELGFTKSSKNYKFYVSDTGIGLNKEDQKRVFQRFEVVEDKTVRRIGGTGLSLTITKYIVERLGGKIKVKSKPGEGSRFQINLPIEPAESNHNQEIKEPSLIPEGDWKDKVILIAEDDELNYRFLDAVLLKTEARILRARNGKEAVDLCRNISQIDLVLMDLKMPVMSGFEAVKIIKKERPGLPVIAQTAFSDRSEIRKCQDIGFEDYITKPIDIHNLTKKISKYF